MTETTETNRDRVRRLLFLPLGFRWPRGTDEAHGRAVLDGIADELGYLADDQLEVLRGMMRLQGQGAAKCWWPERATFISIAHMVAARPLTDFPKLRSWWASPEGQKMVQEGTLVETYEYFAKNFVPPAGHGPCAMVRAAAQANASKLARIEERMRLGWPVTAEDADWHRRYRAKTQELTVLVAQAKHAAQQAREAKQNDGVGQ